jgi:hypothetical protein
MRLVKVPKRPDSHTIRVTLKIGLRTTPESWRDYLYWNMELDES